MKVRAIAVAVFRAVAGSASGSGGSQNVSHIVADVSINSPEGALVDRAKFDRAVTLLVGSRLVEPDGDRLRLTDEGDHFWRRVSHLQPSGMEKWIREAVDTYSRGHELRWAAPDKTWSDAQSLFLERHHSRMSARLEVVDGLVTAIENWHFVSSTIGAAADRSAAVAALQGFPFFFSKVQAIQVLDMRLAQRTALGRLSLAEERDAIRAELEELAYPQPSKEPEQLPTPQAPEPPALQEHTTQETDEQPGIGTGERFTWSG